MLSCVCNRAVRPESTHEVTSALPGAVTNICTPPASCCHGHQFRSCGVTCIPVQLIVGSWQWPTLSTQHIQSEMPGHARRLRSMPCSTISTCDPLGCVDKAARCVYRVETQATLALRASKASPTWTLQDGTPYQQCSFSVYGTAMPGSRSSIMACTVGLQIGDALPCLGSIHIRFKALLCTQMQSR